MERIARRRFTRQTVDAAARLRAKESLATKQISSFRSLAGVLPAPRCPPHLIRDALTPASSAPPLPRGPEEATRLVATTKSHIVLLDLGAAGH